jgi:dihydropteroate synthase
MTHDSECDVNPKLMGILNVTPDSFSDGGAYFTVSQAVDYAQYLYESGADVIDVGAESTKPGSVFVSTDEELSRLIPVLEALAKLSIPVSVDTRRTEVMREVLQFDNVSMINDISSLESDGALELLAQYPKVSVVLMHKQGEPLTMQLSPQYLNVVQDVCAYAISRIKACQIVGIASHRLYFDPGFGFGKTDAHHLELWHELNGELASLGVPILVGLSRKSMLGRICGEKNPRNRLGASIASAVLAAQKGVSYLRVHDVEATRQALSVWRALSKEMGKTFHSDYFG